MNVLLSTSWGRPFCGIQQHSTHLIAAVQVADPTIQITPSEAALDPSSRLVRASVWDLEPVPDILHLNYQRGLHSRWTPGQIASLRSCGWKAKVVVTFHDTFGENPPDDLSKELCDLADAFIVHEPCVGLEQAIYWRMGIPAFDGALGETTGEQLRRPFLGTLGFNFGWKCWSALATAAKAAGWGLLICTPEMSEADEAHLRSKNPWLVVHRGLEHRDVIRTLHECDATAFTNVCGNSGQSAAILDGIAARKPVIALHTCRQYRALLDDNLGGSAVGWVETFEEVQHHLMYLRLGRFDTGIVALAEQDSWEALGRKYADLFRRLVS